MVNRSTTICPLSARSWPRFGEVSVPSNCEVSDSLCSDYANGFCPSALVNQTANGSCCTIAHPGRHCACCPRVLMGPGSVCVSASRSEGRWSDGGRSARGEGIEVRLVLGCENACANGRALVLGRPLSEVALFKEYERLLKLLLHVCRCLTQVLDCLVKVALLC